MPIRSIDSLDCANLRKQQQKPKIAGSKTAKEITDGHKRLMNTMLALAAASVAGITFAVKKGKVDEKVTKKLGSYIKNQSSKITDDIAAVKQKNGAFFYALPCKPTLDSARILPEEQIKKAQEIYKLPYKPAVESIEVDEKVKKEVEDYLKNESSKITDDITAKQKNEAYFKPFKDKLSDKSAEDSAKAFQKDQIKKAQEMYNKPFKDGLTKKKSAKQSAQLFTKVLDARDEYLKNLESDETLYKRAQRIRKKGELWGSKGEVSKMRVKQIEENLSKEQIAALSDRVLDEIICDPKRKFKVDHLDILKTYTPEELINIQIDHNGFGSLVGLAKDNDNLKEKGVQKALKDMKKVVQHSLYLK